jgi:hypothetical protein
MVTRMSREGELTNKTRIKAAAAAANRVLRNLPTNEGREKDRTNLAEKANRAPEAWAYFLTKKRGPNF